MAFYVFPGRDGKYYWRLIAANGEPIADGAEGYNSKEACLYGISLVKACGSVPVYDSK